MTCPYEDCLYTPKKKNDPPIKLIKVHKYKHVIERGHFCPKCKRSFTSDQIAKPVPYYKKERGASA